VLRAVCEQPAAETFVSAAKHFATVNLAFCRIFAKQDQLDTRLLGVLGCHMVPADDVPMKYRVRIANDVAAELESIALRGRRL